MAPRTTRSGKQYSRPSVGKDDLSSVPESLIPPPAATGPPKKYPIQQLPPLQSQSPHPPPADTQSQTTSIPPIQHPPAKPDQPTTSIPPTQQQPQLQSQPPIPPPADTQPPKKSTADTQPPKKSIPPNQHPPTPDQPTAEESKSIPPSQHPPTPDQPTAEEKTNIDISEAPIRISALIDSIFLELQNVPTDNDKFHDVLHGTRVRQTLKRALQTCGKLHCLSPALQKLGQIGIFRSGNDKDVIDWSFFWRLNLICDELEDQQQATGQDLYNALHNNLLDQFTEFMEKCVRDEVLSVESGNQIELREGYPDYKKGMFSFSEWKFLHHLDSVCLNRTKEGDLPLVPSVWSSILDEHKPEDFYQSLKVMHTLRYFILDDQVYPELALRT